MAKPLVIFMVTNNYTPYSGGVVSALDSYTKELRALGHKVIIVTLDFLGASAKHEPDVLRIACPIRFMYHKNHMAIPWRPTNTLAQLIETYKPNIIHTHHPFLLGRSALKAAKCYNIPLVFTYHTMYEQYLHYIPLPTALIKPITQNRVKAFCAQVNALIAPTRSLQQYLTCHNIAHNISIIPSGILPTFIKPVFTYKAPPKERFTLLTVSRFALEKNISFLLKAYSQLDFNRFEFVLIGYGTYLETLQTYAYHTLGLSPQDVRFIIKPSKEDLVAWYDKAHLFLFASQTETQGLVLAEAMARGTPVVALQGSAIEDIVSHTKNGFIIHSQEEMVTTINSIEKNNVGYKELQYAAWQTGLTYHPRECAKRLISLYETTLNSSF